MNHVSESMMQTLLLVVALAVAVLVVTGCGEGASAPATPAAGSGSIASEDAVRMEFDVKGMFCEGCAFSVRSAIAGLDGVESCQVSLDEERAIVSVRNVDTERAILEAVEKLDFTITRRDGDAAADVPEPADG